MNSDLLDTLSDHYKTSDVEVLRTVVPNDAESSRRYVPPDVVWIVRVGNGPLRKTFHAPTFEEAANLAIFAIKNK